jgi:hypothetical protein
VASRGCEGNSKSLYQKYCAWDEADSSGGYDAFMELLASAGFQLNEDGMVVGLCLIQDWLAAWHQEQGRLPQ